MLNGQLNEVTRMFILNCPNTDLALTVCSKTTESWTAYDVHEILNEYNSEKSLRATGKGNRLTKCDEKITVNEIQVSPSPCPVNAEQTK